MIGSIRNYNAEKGYGFIESDQGTDVFFHISQFRAEENQIEPGLAVEFDLGEGRKGVVAVEVTPIGEFTV